MRTDVKVYFHPDGSRYVIVDEIEEIHREAIAGLAMLNMALFEVDGQQACPFEVVLAYSDRPRPEV